MVLYVPKSELGSISSAASPGAEPSPLMDWESSFWAATGGGGSNAPEVLYYVGVDADCVVHVRVDNVTLSTILYIVQYNITVCSVYVLYN